MLDFTAEFAEGLGIVNKKISVLSALSVVNFGPEWNFLVAYQNCNPEIRLPLVCFYRGANLLKTILELIYAQSLDTR